LLLLCDALNEMPFADDRDYRKRVGAWRRFMQEWPGNRVLVTCRSRDYSEPLGLHQVEIERLDDDRVREFLRKYIPEHAATAWARLADSDLLDLVRNPYYLKMLAYLVEEGAAWPARVAELFDGFVRTLVAREARRDHPDWPGAEPLLTALAAFAKTVQPLGAGTRLARNEAQVRIPDEVATEAGTVSLDPKVVIRLGLAATLLDTERAANAAGALVAQVRFYHHQLQEYFAARAMIDSFCAGEDLAARWRQPRLRRAMPDPGPLGDDEPLPPPPTTGWEEPTILAAGLAPRPAALVEAVRAVNPALAARCLTEGRLDLPDVAARVRADLRAEMENPQVHLRARIAAGEALGQVGDPRFEETEVDGQRVLIPPLVAVPGGTYRIGSSRWRVWWLALTGFTAARDETPRHAVTVPTFSIGRYPVTNAEYACFVEAGGYGDAAYWRTPAARAWLRGEGGGAWVEQWLELWQVLQADPEKTLAQLKRAGWTSRQLAAAEQVAAMDEAAVREQAGEAEAERSRDRPAYWDDARYTNPAQPVVGVTWFEARAYCAWLEAQLHVSSSELRVLRNGEVEVVELNPGAFQVRLPSEAEWEIAARGRSGRQYPWGRRWRSGRANTWEGHVLRPTPVGVYSRGRTPDQIEDLAGNVWEWTRSVYDEYPYDPADGREALDAEGARVVRGGSWGSDRRYARCAFRGWGFPDFFYSDYGFRVVVSLGRC
jgi:formylglycine-generating enzyme required for sulfatase activity